MQKAKHIKNRLLNIIQKKIIKIHKFKRNIIMPYCCSEGGRVITLKFRRVKPNMTEETKTKKKLKVKVPTHIVRNEDDYLANGEFLLYARLCFVYFRNYQKKEIELDHRKLMRNCNISDTRTFKKRLKKLYDLGLIENEIKKLPTKGNIEIIFNDDVYEGEKGEVFTMMNEQLFLYLNSDRINEHAFRQIFWYKSNINKKDKEVDRSFSFVGYETLVEQLRVSKATVHKANEQLRKHNLIKIVKHKLEAVDDFVDELSYDRFNNHYYVNNELF